MEQDLFPGVEGRLQFHTRVAINMVDIVARELELGSDQVVRHREVLASFGMKDDAELAAAIAEVGITLSCFELRVPWGPIKKYFSIE